MVILCGTDLSPPAGDAATVAALLAMRLKDRLSLVHVREAGAREPASAPMKERLDEEAERLRALSADVEAQVVDGAAARVLPALAARPDVRMVCVASVGHRKPARWLLGSVAEATSQRSPAPVLVVRDGEPLTSWLRGERPLRVVLAWDRSESSAHALRWWRPLASLAPVETTAVHIAWPPGERARLALGGPVALDRLDPEVEGALQKEMATSLDALLGDRGAKLVLRPNLGRPDVPFLDEVEREHGDLVVVGARQRRAAARLWYPSFSRRVLAASSASVLVVPTRAPTTERAVPVPRLRTVLAATDLTELGDRAVEYALSLTEESGVVHVAHVAGRSDDDERVRERLRALAQRQEERGDIEVAYHVLRGGDVGEAVRALAERIGADVICVASRGPQGIRAAVLGSVTRHLLATSRRPVFVVRERES